MSRKSPSDSSRGFNDVIGVALLLLVALPLLVAQLSFDRYDLSFIHIPANKPVHNWIGPFGAQVAYASFFVFGIGAYAFPLLVAVFGLGYLFNFWPHLRERRLWSGIWGLVLMLSLTGLLNMMDGLFKPLRENVDVQSAGGWVGQTLFQFRLFGFDWGFWVLGSVGATIVYLAFCFISLLFLPIFNSANGFAVSFNKNPPPPNPNPPMKPHSNAARVTSRSRPENCRRKSSVPVWARICSRCRSRLFAI